MREAAARLCCTKNEGEPENGSGHSSATCITVEVSILVNVEPRIFDFLPCKGDTILCCALINSKGAYKSVACYACAFPEFSELCLQRKR
jgi:hypothetical protein